MSNAAKNLLLSQPKAGLIEGNHVMTLPHKLRTEVGEKGSEITVAEIEIPGVDPSTVDVISEGSTVVISCAKGSATVPFPAGTDVGKITANIQWGVLTLTAPLPELPAPRAIKVGITETPSKKASAKVTDED